MPAPVDVPLRFVLRPTVVYDGVTGTPAAVATLSLPPEGFAALVAAYGSWLLRTWGSWADVAAALGAALAAEPPGWGAALAAFLADDVTFPVAAADDAGDGAVAFPLLDGMGLSWGAGATPGRSLRTVSDGWFRALARDLAGGADPAALGERASARLLGGVRLPDPVTGEEAGLYAVTGQQALLDPAAEAVEATLTPGPDAACVTARMAVPAVGAAATFTVTTLPAAVPADVWSVQLDRVPWGADAYVVPLPPALRALTRDGPVTLTVLPRPAGAGVTPLAAAPGLLVPVGAEPVDGAPGVYRLGRVDDECGQRLAALGDDAALTDTTVSLLSAAPGGGYAVTTPDPATVVLAAPRAADPAAPAAASAADAAAFVRLLARGGAYLRVPAETDAPVAVAFSAASGQQAGAWCDAVVIAADGVGDGALHLGAARDGVPVRELRPAYPPGSAGVAADGAGEGPYSLLACQVGAAWSPPADARGWRAVVPVAEPVRFRLSDAYGNVLDATAQSATFDAPCTDPLVPPRLTYEVLAGPPRLRLSATRTAADPAVVAQLDDVRTSVSLTTTALPGWTADDATLRAWLRAAAAGGPAAPLDLPIDPAALRAYPTALVPLTVTLTLARPAAAVFTDADGRTVPGSQCAEQPLAPDLDPAAVEAAFAGFDGADGTVRLLAGADGARWLLRWSTESGVTAAVRAGRAAYHALAPLHTTPYAGEAVVPVYDAALVPTRQTRTFAAVDLDQWAGDCLATVDGLLAPEPATALVAADPAAYDAVVRAAAVLARAVAAGVLPVFAEGEAAVEAGVVAGDAAAARAAVAEAALATAYGSTVVQVPVTVTAAAPAAGAVLAGHVVTTAPGVTTGGARLPLAAAAPAWLTFLVTADEPARAARQPLPLTYRAGSVDAPAAAGLRVAGDGIGLGLGTLDVPVPSRRQPLGPVVAAQSAAADQGPAGGGLAAYLRWAYQVDLTLDGTAQDALVVDVGFNGPAAPPPVVRGPADPSRGVFEALASFTTAWPRLAPYVAALPASTDGGPPPATVAAAVRDQVRLVAEAWARLRGVPVPAAPRDGLASPPPGQVTDRYVVSYAEAATGTLVVLAAGEAAWPLVDGRPPRAAPEPAAGAAWRRAEYDHDGTSALSLRWPGLDVVARQTASSVFRLVRNDGLGPGLPTDAAFVYRTPPVSAGPSVVPLIEVPPLDPLPAAASLTAALIGALGPLAGLGLAVSPAPTLALSVTYSYALAGAGVRASEPVLRAAVPVPSDITRWCAQVAAQCQAWWEQARPEATDARLELGVVVTAEVGGAEVPLLSAPEVLVEVPPGWWPPPAG